MKKQIFILLVALFAVTSAFGQLTPRALTCTVGTEGPLFPALGKSYTYEVTIPNSALFTGASPVLTYQWYVTKDFSFVSPTKIANGGTDFDATIASGTFDSPANTVIPVSIKWKTTATQAAPYFLVVKVVGADPSCSTQNMKVYKIIPSNMFTLDIANVNPATSTILATETPFSQCISDIVSVTYAAASPDDATYDYGSNTLIWAVAAANWSTSWTPSLLTSGIDANETVTLTWNTKADGTGTGGTFTTSDGSNWTTATPVTPSTGVSVDAAGETIYIRMILDHSTPGKNYEGLADEVITLAVDGLTANGDHDLHYSATLPVANALCGLDDDFTYDTTTQTVTARPGINTATLPATQDFLNPIPAP